MPLRSSVDLLRPRELRSVAKVTVVELFFDLVFVFAITQLSHTLLHHFTVTGVLGTTLLLLAVWRVWIATTWVTDWLNPEQARIQVMLFVLMLAGLVVSMSIPTAYEGGGLRFAVAYAFMQVGRTVFTLWALAGRSPEKFALFHRMTYWLSLSAVAWVAGGTVDGEWRVVAWTAALVIEYVAPAVGFWTPWQGRAASAQWNVSGEHMAERCGLFVIICLGEAILVIGAAFAQMAWTLVAMSAFLAAFVGIVALWGVYFYIGHTETCHLIDAAPDPGRLARLWFTYTHIPIVAGIIFVAASNRLVLDAPTGPASTEAALALLGGPALFLAGALWLRIAAAGGPPTPHVTGLALIGGATLAAGRLSPLALAIIAAMILVVVAAWERVRRGSRVVSAL